MIVDWWSMISADVRGRGITTDFEQSLHNVREMALRTSTIQ
jgi:hypothetical protein